MTCVKNSPAGSKRKKLPELLSPCGSPESLDAAILGGADAVYLGGSAFNARMNARNFSDDALREAISRCHTSGVRVYVTLNTLIYDREMNDALRYAAFLYEAGTDALIVTDLGLTSLIRSYMPSFPLHASTQASGHSAAAAGALH
jgi:putative protease